MRRAGRAVVSRLGAFAVVSFVGGGVGAFVGFLVGGDVGDFEGVSVG